MAADPLADSAYLERHPEILEELEDASLYCSVFRVTTAGGRETFIAYEGAYPPLTGSDVEIVRLAGPGYDLLSRSQAERVASRRNAAAKHDRQRSAW